jgi:hypothetical protein
LSRTDRAAARSRLKPIRPMPDSGRRRYALARPAGEFENAENRARRSLVRSRAFALPSWVMQLPGFWLLDSGFQIPPYFPGITGSGGSTTVVSLSQPSFSSLMDSIAIAVAFASRSGNAVYSETQHRKTL